MTFVAACLLIALASAGTIIVLLVGALYRLAVERNESNHDAEGFEREADGLQELLNETRAELEAALGREVEALAWAGVLIANERHRQISEEGWTRQHDHAHGSPVLSRAARQYELHHDNRVPEAWPWDAKWWKPKGVIRDLVRAGALYRAAIDVAPPLGNDRSQALLGLQRCEDALASIFLAFGDCGWVSPAQIADREHEAWDKGNRARYAGLRSGDANPYPRSTS